jgi:hypothetical protein
MHRKPKTVITGQEPKIIPINFIKSSANLKIRKTIKAGTIKIPK